MRACPETDRGDARRSPPKAELSAPLKMVLRVRSGGHNTAGGLLGEFLSGQAILGNVGVGDLDHPMA